MDLISFKNIITTLTSVSEINEFQNVLLQFQSWFKVFVASAAINHKSILNNGLHITIILSYELGARNEVSKLR